ncbi:DUF503 domain-containing protein [Allofustis seminis]|uniref:DUF503 domain-containing protein n=1 Tax=Allofustis seminis TaxID=166939 RepID=UPI000375F237|nr:DUF503 domain-containing protein [Allofustis seminis]
MYLTGIEVTLYLYESQSLKDKRRIVQSILDQVHHKFYVAGAEVSDQELLNQAILGFAAVSGDGKYVEKILQKVIDLIDRRFDCEIMTIHWMRY